jgi:hypothetical protein
MTHSAPPPAPSHEQRQCIKCGRDVEADASICEVCNRAGMATPSASQYHGTVAAAIVLAVIGLAVAASLSLRGVGPYSAAVDEVTPAERGGYTITYAVTNEGTKPGRAKCQLVAIDDAGRRVRSLNTITDQVAGGATSRLSETVPGLEEEPADVTVTCS